MLRMQTAIAKKQFLTGTTMEKSTENQNSIIYSSSSQDLFDQILEMRDEVDDFLVLNQHIRQNKVKNGDSKVQTPGGKKQRKYTENESSDSTSKEQDTDTPSTASQQKMNRFAIRMSKHMNFGAHTTSSESSSSHSRPSSYADDKLGLIDISHLNITEVPAQSDDNQNSEEIEQLIDQDELEEELEVMQNGLQYKISIMKQKRRIVNEDIKQQDDMLESIKLNKCDLQTENRNHFSQPTQTLQNQSDDGAEIKVRETAQIRSRLMSKLMINKMIDSQMAERKREKNYLSIVIWDWDDTLSPSTFLQPFVPEILRPTIRKKIPKAAIQQLDKLEQSVINLLRKSMQFGSTYIITNAGAGWIELSSARFLPRLYKEIIEKAQPNGLQIISARALYEKNLPNGFKEWKQRTFLQLATELNKNILTNIVVIGDSQIEIDAASLFAEQFKQSCLKTVKLKEKPNCVELIRQIELVSNQFDDICGSAKNLTIKLQRIDDESQQKEIKKE